ncbi:hypothetical protein B0H63DRAFT_58566 [Podospora didyma]|uniref:Uncharacterized protein n=1 Tax=Podospora didyma TaxID=330526 RepID=A0AAE0U8T8_9PEZI|nr:hypothetical protein B0H63DRAFT_58566 [Podospora didyma]
MASTHRRGLPLGTVMGDLCKRFLKRRHRLSLGDAMWNTQAKPSQPSLVVTNLETRLKKNKPRQPTCLPKVASIVRVHPAATQPNQILPASPPFHAVRSSFKDLSPRLDLRLLYYNTNTMKSGGLQDNFSCHGKSWNTAMALLSHHGVSKSISEETRSSIIARQDIFLLKIKTTSTSTTRCTTRLHWSGRGPSWRIAGISERRTLRFHTILTPTLLSLLLQACVRNELFLPFSLMRPKRRIDFLGFWWLVDMENGLWGRENSLFVTETQ